MKRLILYTALFTWLGVQSQHKGDYVQYMFNGFLINPAYCGSQGALNVSGLYRNQWLGIDGAPVYKSLTAHTPLKNKKLNLGLLVENDRFGVYDQSRVNAAYAYRIKFLNGQIAFGLQAGLEITSTNWNKMIVQDASDPNFAFGASRSVAFTAGAGTYYHNKKFYLGLSCPQLYNNVLHTARTTVLNGGLLIKAGELITIKPAFLVKHIRSSQIFNVSSTIYYKELLGLGAGLTPGSSWMLFADIRVNEQLHFGYGYDRALSHLKSYSAGSHEVLVRYLFSYRLKVQNARYF